MSGTSQPNSFYIGWDVGGWNCDNNGKSRDAIVILDSERSIVGRPWRGNLRATINSVSTCQDWIDSLFSLCEAPGPEGSARFVMAVDTPLGFPESLAALINGEAYVAELDDSANNPYLFRLTERYLFEQGLKPLSAVKDMIGSQATKGMHLLAKLGIERVHCGLWVEGGLIAVIETYPAPCRHSALINAMLRPYIAGKREDGTFLWAQPIKHQDEVDALVCALVADCFDVNPDELAGPIERAPEGEGWIWLPSDVLAHAPHHTEDLGMDILVSTNRGS